MDRYSNISNSIFPVFGTEAWKAEKIRTFAANHIGVNTSSEYIRVSVIPNGSGSNLKSMSGVLMIDIFTKAGMGPNRFFSIADKLDSYLVGQGKRPSEGKFVQFFSSSLQPNGLDKDDPTLFRTTYSIPFNYTEVM
jgi:hypothetical protein